MISGDMKRGPMTQEQLDAKSARIEEAVEAIEAKYGCHCFQETGFDDKRKYWVAYCTDDDSLFGYADGWTLQELVDNIEREIGKRKVYEYKHPWVKTENFELFEREE